MAASSFHSRMREHFMPFSKSTRACLGRNLALIELRLLTLALIRRFDVKAATETSSDSMEMRDHFLMAPKAGKCDLMFEMLGE
jgi:cytochrome P450